jgi:hypothetical protein
MNELLLLKHTCSCHSTTRHGARKVQLNRECCVHSRRSRPGIAVHPLAARRANVLVPALSRTPLCSLHLCRCIIRSDALTPEAPGLGDLQIPCALAALWEHTPRHARHTRACALPVAGSPVGLCHSRAPPSCVWRWLTQTIIRCKVSKRQTAKPSGVRVSCSASTCQPMTSPARCGCYRAGTAAPHSFAHTTHAT